MPELDIWLDEALRAKPRATNKTLWRALPTEDDLAKVYRDGDNVVIVASKGGHPRHPSWFHNLRANPDTVVQIGSRRQAVRARVADPQEHQRLWPKALEVYPGYDTYQQRTAREIPLVILEPRR